MTVSLSEDDLDVLPIAVLRIDLTYQRERREHLIRKILRSGFDMNAAYPIIVSERPPIPPMTEPRYFNVDGQHRVGAAEREGETEVICKIVRFSGSEAKIVQQEAALRTKMGERKPDTPMERFKSKLRSGDDEALRIDSLVESFGGRIAQSQNQAHAIQAVSTLEKLYRRDVLTSVLRVIKDAWDSFDGRAGEAAMLDALAWLIQKHPDYDSTHLTRRLRGTPPEAVHARATAIQAGMGGSLWKNHYRAVLEFYNQRAPKKIKKLTPIDF
jgi:hypothetical protein